MAEALLECVALTKVYADAGRSVAVLSGVDFRVDAGDRVAVVGASGSGKSTLLNLLGGLDEVTSGTVSVAGRDLATLSERELCAWRNRKLGFVYQFHHLLPEFDARENVAMPLLIAGYRKREALAEASALLERVGLGGRTAHRPAQLSGGERQRVAIARALVARPACVLMDEPTGNLDPEASERILALIEDLSREASAFVVVTHDPAVAAHLGRRVVLRGGRLSEAAP